MNSSLQSDRHASFSTSVKEYIAGFRKELALGNRWWEVLVTLRQEYSWHSRTDAIDTSIPLTCWWNDARCQLGIAKKMESDSLLIILPVTLLCSAFGTRGRESVPNAFIIKVQSRDDDDDDGNILFRKRFFTYRSRIVATDDSSFKFCVETDVFKIFFVILRSNWIKEIKNPKWNECILCCFEGQTQ